MTNICSNTTPNSTTHVFVHVIKTSTHIPLHDKKNHISRSVTTDVYFVWYLILLLIYFCFSYTYCVTKLLERVALILLTTRTPKPTSLNWRCVFTFDSLIRQEEVVMLSWSCCVEDYQHNLVVYHHVMIMVVVIFEKPLGHTYTLHLVTRRLSQSLDHHHRLA